MPFSREVVEANTKSTLTLVPQYSTDEDTPLQPRILSQGAAWLVHNLPSQPTRRIGYQPDRGDRVA